ncbi:MAG TPA: multidrug efflux SMR transporter [Dongiaceae bacterium]|nr:multidrug efflux SMR transporter [Dongiaceae bacterium]
MAWLYLFLAGILEVLWAFMMKQSDGFSRLLPSAVTILVMIASFGLLSLSMRSLPLGTAYAVWTGIGALGALVLGVTALGEQAGALRIASAALVLVGLVGLKMTSGQ